VNGPRAMHRFHVDHHIGHEVDAATLEQLQIRLACRFDIARLDDLHVPHEPIPFNNRQVSLCILELVQATIGSCRQ
jgi:hypothetical protein